MKKPAVVALLVLALIVPVALFWWLSMRYALGIGAAAAIAVAAGWALNIAWAFAAQAPAAADPAQAQDNTRAIAARFGWVCPTVLVLLTWLVRRFVLPVAA